MDATRKSKSAARRLAMAAAKYLGHKMKLFGLIGAGKISLYHKKAIEHNGGKLIATYDPAKTFGVYPVLNSTFFENLDFVVICSPSYLHYEHIKTALKYLPAGAKIICEKPAFLPWQPIIDNDRINIIMQLRDIHCGGKPEKIKVQMIRDKNYMDSWKGQLSQSGGFIISLFIHYIDLAIRHRCKFVGRVLEKGKNYRLFDDIDLMKIDSQTLFDIEYGKILAGYGNRPADLFYLYWAIGQLIEQYGPGQLFQQIEFDGVRYGI
jgi:hypothetical protein